MSSFKSAAPIRVHYEYDGTTTKAHLALPVEDGGPAYRLIATGIAKQHPGDTYDKAVGTQVALSRALVRLAEFLA